MLIPVTNADVGKVYNDRIMSDVNVKAANLLLNTTVSLHKDYTALPASFHTYTQDYLHKAVFAQRSTFFYATLVGLFIVCFLVLFVGI